MTLTRQKKKIWTVALGLTVFFTLTALTSCGDSKKETDIPNEMKDIIYSQKYFAIDSTTAEFQTFYKQGAIKGYYVHKLDWIDGELKTYTLFDKNDNVIFTFGIRADCLFGDKNEYNNEQLIKIFKLDIDSCFDDPTKLFDSDSIFLQTIIPLTNKKWIELNDSTYDK